MAGMQFLPHERCAARVFDDGALVKTHRFRKGTARLCNRRMELFQLQVFALIQAWCVEMAKKHCGDKPTNNGRQQGACEQPRAAARNGSSQRGCPEVDLLRVLHRALAHPGHRDVDALDVDVHDDVHDVSAMPTPPTPCSYAPALLSLFLVPLSHLLLSR